MTMPTIFDVTVSPEDGEEPFFPTDEDQVEWVLCDGCGDEKPLDSPCAYCDSEESLPSDDFPMYLEYEGVTGLAGYDSFYDNDSDLMHEW